MTSRKSDKHHTRELGRVALGLGVRSNQSQNKTQVLVNQLGGREGRAEGLELQISYDTQINLTIQYSNLELREDRSYSKDFKIISLKRRAVELGTKQFTNECV